MAPPSGAVAQMGERCNRTAEVRGSIPLGSTNDTHDSLAMSARQCKLGNERLRTPRRQPKDDLLNQWLSFWARAPQGRAPAAGLPGSFPRPMVAVTLSRPCAAAAAARA